MYKIYLKIRELLNSGDQRTALAKKNIVGSFSLKIIDVLVDFLFVPLSLAYLTQTDYGIWLTINSMVNWLNFFDIGISHGYRNKLAEAINDKNYLLAKIYTSTSYGIIGFISLIISIIGIIIIPFIDWSYILNVNDNYSDVLILVMYTVVVTFALRLTLKIITTVVLANQMPFWNNLINTIIKITAFIGIAVLVFYTKGDLLLYAMIYSILPLIVLLISSFLFFKKKYYAYRPSFEYFDKGEISSLMGLGIKFFIIQIGATMLFMSDNLIISHVLDPSYVTPYEIAHKYFGIPLIIFSIIIAPFWSATTEAYSKDEFFWIKNSILRLNKLWGLIVILTLLLLFLFYPVLQVWVGDEVDVPIILAIQWGLFTCLQSYNMIYTYFLNGTGKIFLQLVTSCLTLIINIPLSIFFAKNLNLGSSGVLMATNFSILVYIVTRKIQYYKLINKRAHGIWAR